jgi:hypothetical protein
VAAKDLVIDGVQVAAGAELVTVETAVPIERALNAIAIGSAAPPRTGSSARRSRQRRPRLRAVR